MLVLSRGLEEEVIIGDGIRIKIVELTKHKVKLGITAPRDIPVDRQEVLIRKQETLKK